MGKDFSYIFITLKLQLIIFTDPDATMCLSLAVTGVTCLWSVSCLPKLASSNMWFSVKGILFIVHVRNAYGAVEVQHHSFLISASNSGVFFQVTMHRIKFL
jgi:hypothetical protein